MRLKACGGRSQACTRRAKNTECVSFRARSSPPRGLKVVGSGEPCRSFVEGCVISTDVFVVGGIQNEETEAAIREAEEDRRPGMFRYDTVADVWHTLSVPDWVAESEYYNGVCALGGVLYILGGNFDDEDVMTFRAFQSFDTASGEWKALAPLKSSGSVCGIFETGGCIFAPGGYGNKDHPQHISHGDAIQACRAARAKVRPLQRHLVQRGSHGRGAQWGEVGSRSNLCGI